MKLTRLTLKNIRSYADGQITFPEGSTLLSGDIGSGKTTILLAIEFALFGLQPGQKASGLLSSSQDSGEVLLELELEGKPVVIERALKRGSKSISHESAFLTWGGVREELSVTELKMRILKLLNYPEEFVKKTNLLYRYTVYSPQEEMKQIILEDPESRLNIIRHIFGIDKYKKIRENLALVAARFREESRALSAELKSAEEEKSRMQLSSERALALKQKLEVQGRKIVDRKGARKKAEFEIKDLESKINEKKNFEKEIEKTQVLASAKSQQYAERTLLMKDLERKTSPLALIENSTLSQLTEALRLNRQRAQELSSSSIELSSRLKSLQSKKTEQAEKRKRIFQIEICPTCLQDVSEVHKHNILNEVESTTVAYDKELAQITLELTALTVEQKKNELEYQSIIEHKSKIEITQLKLEESRRSAEQLASLIKTQEALKKDIDFLNTHLTTLKASVLDFSRYENLYRAKELELRQLFNEEKKVEIEYAELNKEEELLRQEISRLEKRLEEKDKLREKMNRLLKVESWLSGEFSSLVSYTERNILLKLREEFSKLFNKWFSLLTADSFYVQLDETFTPIIVQGDYELDYAFLSGGERTAVALAYRLALNQVINSIFSSIQTRDILILDEPTDGFSEQQLDKVRDILNDLNVKQLILVSHEQKIEGFVDNIIRFKKENGKTILP